MNRLISVIVPVYKVENYLDECMESIVSQTYRDLEIIVVDDGSPDYCPDKCDEWAKKDSRIRVIHKENGGLSDARNVGLDIAKGDRVIFIDSDDYIASTMIEEMNRVMLEQQCDIVMCNKAIVTLSRIEKERDDGKIDTYQGEEIIDNYLYHRNNFCSGVWNKLIRMELVAEIRFPKGLNSEDYYFYSFLYYKAKKMVVYHRAFYYYRQRKGSICHSGINEQTFGKIKIAELVKKNLEGQGCTNVKGINHFCMQAFHDVLNDLVERTGDKTIIHKYTKKLRNYYWSTIFDNKNTFIEKVKMTFFCTFPIKYTKLKNKIINKSYETDQSDWFV